MKSLIQTFEDVIASLVSLDSKTLLTALMKEAEKIKIIIKACLLAQQKLETRENKQLTCIVKLLNIIVKLDSELTKVDYLHDDEPHSGALAFHLHSIFKLSVETINFAIRACEVDMSAPKQRLSIKAKGKEKAQIDIV